MLQERSNDGPTGGDVPQKKKAGAAQQAPRRYIDQQEFESVSTYMRGRLTAEKVNSALDELATLAETNVALITAARKNKPMGADKKHAIWLLYNIECHPNLKGRCWVMEADLKNGTAVRLDKTGKSVLTLLRHLGRLSETRISVDGTSHLVYCMV